MRPNAPIIIAALLLASASFCPIANAQSPQSAAPSAEHIDTNVLVGTWNFSFPDGEPNMQIELEADGKWRCWNPSRQPDPAASVIIQSGSWFVGQNVFVLRIEKNDSGVSKIPPGMAYTFDVKSISSKTAIFIWPDGNREFKWTRAR